jgi:ABC-2 type transport system permease protein
MMEPIVVEYFLSLLPVIVVIFVPSVFTMRLLSEEQRTGTMEVLLTAPVGETVVVFSKFIAALLMFLIAWTPLWLYLLAIPLMGGTPFDYRPLLGFLVTLTVTGAGFIAMGLFFSSVTKNQIAAGVLTLAGMLVLTAPYLVQRFVRDPAITKVLFHISYINLWWETLRGKIVPQFLLFYLSLASLSLFLTVKVLESRKWR